MALKAKARTILLIAGVLLTLGLAVSVIVISTTLQKTGSKPVAPTVPASKPKADTSTSCSLAFRVGGTPPASPPPTVGVCEEKMAFEDVATNSAGNYKMDDTTRITAGGNVGRGTQFVYRMYAPANAQQINGQIIWEDTLDSRLTFVDAESGCTYSAASKMVVCRIPGPIAAGQSYARAFRVRVADAAKLGTLNNSATITTAGRSADNCAIALNIVAVPKGCSAGCTDDADCAANGLICSNGMCRKQGCEGESLCVCPLASPTPSPTPSPSPIVCSGVCTDSSQCPSGLICTAIGGTKMCRRDGCTNDPNCEPCPSVNPLKAGFRVRKFNDANANGSQDTTESGLSWNFEWDLNNDNNWRSYVTYADNSGEGGVVGDLDDGAKIRVREKSKDGWSATTATQLEFTVTKGSIYTAVFGNRQRTAIGCNNSCSTDSDCVSGLSCINSMCRYEKCNTKSNCVCDIVVTAKATPTPKTIAEPEEKLPVAGSGLETAAMVIGGTVVTILGVIGFLAL